MEFCAVSGIFCRSDRTGNNNRKSAAVTGKITNRGKTPQNREAFVHPQSREERLGKVGETPENGEESLTFGEGPKEVFTDYRLL